MENVDALASSKQKIEIPLATGECLYTKFEFREILARQAADIIQPDVCVAGGIMELKKIAAMAEAHYVMVAPHNPMGPLATMVNVQRASAGAGQAGLGLRDRRRGDPEEPAEAVASRVRVPPGRRPGFYLGGGSEGRSPFGRESFSTPAEGGGFGGSQRFERAGRVERHPELVGVTDANH